MAKKAKGATAPTTTLDELAAEGPLLDFRAAAQAAGFPGLSYWAMFRGARQGALVTARLGGRRVTTAPAVRRWLAGLNEPTLPPAAAPQRRRGRRARAKTSPAEAAYLRSRGLPAGGGA